MIIFLHRLLRKKREPKQCPWGTVLENGALFSKNGTKTARAPKYCPRDSVLQTIIRAPFRYRLFFSSMGTSNPNMILSLNLSYMNPNLSLPYYQSCITALLTFASPHLQIWLCCWKKHIQPITDISKSANISWIRPRKGGLFSVVHVSPSSHWDFWNFGTMFLVLLHLVKTSEISAIAKLPPVSRCVSQCLRCVAQYPYDPD